jgi:hypothetical protein
MSGFTLGEGPQYPLSTRLYGNQSRSEPLEKRKRLPVLGYELQIPSLHSLIAVPTYCTDIFLNIFPLRHSHFVFFFQSRVPLRQPQEIKTKVVLWNCNSKVIVRR